MIQHDKKVHIDDQKQEQIISNEIQSDVEKTGQYVEENNDQVAVNLQQEDSQKDIENFVEEALPKEIGVFLHTFYAIGNLLQILVHNAELIHQLLELFLLHYRRG